MRRPADAAAEGLAPREALADALRRALADPGSLGPATLEVLAAALQSDAADDGGGELALAVLAALLYARPDLVEDSLLDQVANLLRAGPPSEMATSLVVTLWAVFAASPLAPRAWTLLDALVRDEGLDPGTRARLLPLVEDFVQWREDVVELDGVLRLAESPLLESHRAFLLDYGVERFVFCAPETFTTERLDRLATLFGHVPRFRYVLSALAARPGLTPDVRAILARQLAGRFPLHGAAAAILTARPVRLLVALNVGQGQGDDVVRLAPLLQALLDANPGLTITLVTWRPYLYDGPRVVPIAIHDDVAIQAALREPFEGILEFFQPDWPDFTYRIELHVAIERAIAERRPAFLLRADLGRAHENRPGGRSAFLYQTVELNGRDVAHACGLDELTLRNIYDPGLRLLAELGLPQRAGEEPALTPWLLTGTRSMDAERVWADLLAEESGVSARPVALVNPFGGSGRTKGFLEQDAVLAAEIEGLVDEGYRVVLLPNGTAWGGPSAVTSLLGRLGPRIRAHVTMAPDPAERADAAQWPLGERPELRYADRVMRLFKYFTTYADLVVTVEGWMSHFAYNLGRPFRLFLAAGSFSFEWYPHGRSRSQRLVTALSSHAHAAHARAGLLGEGDPPPLPHRPRKRLLESALAGLGRVAGPDATAILRRALTSADPDIRTGAAAALGLSAAAAKAALLAALADPWPTVVREAADALLREGVDCSRELGPRYRERLQAYADVVRGNWDAAGRVGLDAWPALFHAGRSEYDDVRRGAKLMLGRTLSPYVRRRLAPDPPAAPDGGARRE